VQNNIKQAFIKIKKRNTLDSNSLSPMESNCGRKHLQPSSFIGRYALA